MGNFLKKSCPMGLECFGRKSRSDDSKNSINLTESIDTNSDDKCKIIETSPASTQSCTKIVRQSHDQQMQNSHDDLNLKVLQEPIQLDHQSEYSLGFSTGSNESLSLLQKPTVVLTQPSQESKKVNLGRNQKVSLTELSNENLQGPR